MHSGKNLPRMTLTLRIEPGPYWWEASALTTTQKALRCFLFCFFFSLRIIHLLFEYFCLQRGISTRLQHKNLHKNYYAIFVSHNYTHVMITCIIWKKKGIRFKKEETKETSL